MGMDVYGKDPVDDSGVYFRANDWYWHPLWGMIEDLYPDIAGKVPNAHYNDGDGLNKKDSLTLANLMKSDLESGKLDQYVNKYEEQRSNIPKLPCHYCNETGQRIWPQEDGSALQKECNSCKGTALMDDFDSHYPMHIDVVKEFITFVENSGGFNIC